MIRYFAGHEKKLANNKRGGNFIKKIILAFGMVLATAFACFAASPAKDFDYHLMSQSELTDLSQYVSGLNAKGDFIEITGYKGSDSTVEIPAEIEGCKVIKVSFVFADKIVVPASVIWFDAGRGESGGTEFEFQRPKNAAFFWEIHDLGNVKNLELDRKIVFVCTDNSSSIYIPMVESFTWSKNWNTMFIYSFGSEPKYNSLECRLGYKYENVAKELIIEDGFTELPFTINDACEKLVLPKTLKTIRINHTQWGNAGTIISDDFYRNLNEIVIPAGAKIKIEPGAIRGVGHMSITTQKALKAQGYSW